MAHCQPTNGGAPTAYHMFLPGIIGKNPSSFVNFVDDRGQRNIIVGSGTGLHLLRVIEAKNGNYELQFIRTIETGACEDVILIKRPPLVSKNGTESLIQQNRFLVAALFADRGKNDKSASIMFLDGASLDGELSAARVTCDQAWGRVRKMAFSFSLDRIYITTTMEHQLAGIHQSGAIWAIPVTIPLDSTYPPCSMAFRITEKKPGDFRHLAINDELRLLAVSDRNDGVQHSVNLYDAISGSFLYHVNKINSNVGFCPRGLAFNGDILYVADESGRIQRFNVWKLLCDALAFETPYNFPEVISINENVMVVLGSQQGKEQRSLLSFYKL